MPWITRITQNEVELAKGIGTYPKSSIENSLQFLDKKMVGMKSIELVDFSRSLTFTTKFE